jgi:hypothetical protein
VYRELIQPIAPTTLYRDLFLDGQCNPEPLDEAALYYTTAELDFDEYVTASERFVPIEGEPDLELRYLVAEDGASWLSGPLTDGQPCTLARGTDGAEYCLPADWTTRSDLFAGPTCEAPPLAYAASDCAGRRGRAITRELDAFGCSRVTAAYEVGDLVEVPYWSQEGLCTAYPTVPSQCFAELGEPIPSSTLPELVPVSFGAGRLEARYRAVGEGRLASSLDWFDNDLGVACSDSLMSDGTWRCVPYRESEQSSHFADPECTVPLFVRPPSCDPPGPSFRTTTAQQTNPETGACEYSTTAVFLLGVHAGPVYELDGNCVAGVPPEGEVLLSDVREVMADELAELFLEPR